MPIGRSSSHPGIMRYMLVFPSAGPESAISMRVSVAIPLPAGFGGL